MTVNHNVTPERRSRGGPTGQRVDPLTERQIKSAVRSDPDAAPVHDKKWFAKAKLVMPERTVPVSLRIDREVVDWFKSHCARYQSRMDAY